MLRLGLKVKHQIAASQMKHLKFPLEHQETLFYCMWLSTGPDCPGRLCSLHPQRYSEANSIRWPCFSREIGQMTSRVQLEVLLTSTILWFFEISVTDVRSRKYSCRFQVYRLYIYSWWKSLFVAFLQAKMWCGIGWRILGVLLSEGRF